MLFIFHQVEVHHFYRPKNSNNSLIREQKSNKHIADGHKKLFRAFKHEAVQFLVAKNLAVSHLPLEAFPVPVKRELQTTNATARPWSRDMLWFAVFHEKPDDKVSSEQFCPFGITVIADQIIPK